MLEMETMDLDGGRNSAGATTLVGDLAKACEKKVQLNVVWKWAIYFDSPLRVLRVLNVCIMNRQHGPVQLEVIDHGSGAHRRHPAHCELQNGRTPEGVLVRRKASTQTS